MTYPAGLPTKQVSFGSAVVLEGGAPLAMRVTVSASRSLVHRPSGAPLIKVATQFSSVGAGDGLVTLPICDSPNMGAGDGTSIALDSAHPVTHLYTALINYYTDDTFKTVIAGASRTVGPFALLAASPSVNDVDDLLVGSPPPLAGEAVVTPAQYTAQGLQALGLPGDADTLSASIAAVSSEQRTLEVAGLDQVRSGLDNRRLSPFDWFALGHSWIEGEGVTNRVDRFIDRMLVALRSKFPTSVGGSFVTGGEGYLPFVSFESTWTNPWSLSGGATTEGYGIGGRCAHLSGPGQKITRNDVFCTSFDVIWLPANGVIKVSIDGAGATTLPVAGSSFDTQRWNSGPLGLGFHDIVIEHASGASTYPGGAFVCEGDENAGVRLVDSGHNGWTTSDWRTYTSGGGFFGGAYNGLPGLGPDLVTITALVNDYNTGVAPTTTQANLTGIITDLRGLHDVKGSAHPSFLIVGEMQPTSVVSPGYPWSAYLAAAQAVADADSQVGFINLSSVLDTTDDPQGTLAADLLHPSAKGAAWMANVVVAAF